MMCTPALMSFNDPSAPNETIAEGHVHPRLWSYVVRDSVGLVVAPLRKKIRQGRTIVSKLTI